ncbi:MAG: hypothetical protein AAB358_03005 [Patescibacteria group bacterium]
MGRVIAGQAISDADLGWIFWTLFQALKKSAKKGRYISFQAESIEFIGERKIRFKTGDDFSNLRQSLRALGVLMYYLATGQSELHNESIMLDGYLPLASEHWRAISFLLSGQAFSLPQLETMLVKPKSQIAARLKLIVLWPLSVLALIAAWFKKIPGLTKKIMGWAKNEKVVVGGRITALAILTSATIIIIVWYFAFWFSFFTSWSLILLPVVIISIFLIIGIVIALIFFSSRLEPPKLFLPEIFYFLLLVISLVLFSFHVPVNKKHIAKEAVLVNRQTGEFAGRLELKKDDEFLVWPHYFINPLVWKLAPGILPEKKLAVAKNGFSFILAYQILTKEKYIAAWQKWGEQAKLEADLQALFDSLEVEEMTPSYEAEVRVKSGLGGPNDHLDEEIRTAAIMMIDNQIEELREKFKSDIKTKQGLIADAVKEKLKSSPLAEFFHFSCSPAPPVNAAAAG